MPTGEQTLEVVLQTSSRWPEEEEGWKVLRNKTSPCISLGPFLSTYNK